MKITRNTSFGNTIHLIIGSNKYKVLLLLVFVLKCAPAIRFMYLIKPTAGYVHGTCMLRRVNEWLRRAMCMLRARYGAHTNSDDGHTHGLVRFNNINP